MHVRCPHCRSPIELVEDTALAEITCLSCGSSFNLISDGTTASYHEAGKTIGHFQLVQLVGVGHFGSVWKARDSELDRTVAIKIPRSESLDPDRRELFFREARAAAQLRHPNIVSVHEVGRDDSTIYIVSDFVDGANLKEWLSARKPTSREAAELCIQIADALHHAHEAGIVHRDLKPGNVMMDSAGKPSLMDFGLAKREAGEITMTMEGQILGTPAYMSPEQARGEGHGADRRSDVYSLGVMLFEMLTGELPFRGEKRMLIVQILNDDPPSPRRLNAHVPRDLETICLTCLEKDAERRYQTARDFADDLQRYLKGEPITARPVGRFERAWRWCRRNPLVASLTAIIAIILVVATIGSSVSAVNFRALANQRRDAQRDAEDARAVANDSLEHVRRRLYAQQLKLAQSAWEKGDVRRSLELLELQKPGGGESDLRGFEWYYLWRLCHRTPTALEGHERSVNCVVFSPDGRTVATASDDTAVKLWDVSRRELVGTLKSHTAPVRSVAFSDDGHMLATASEDKTVRLWDRKTLREITILKHEGRVTYVAFSADDNSLIVSCLANTRSQSRFRPMRKRFEVRIWDLKSRKVKQTLLPDNQTHYSSSSDDECLVAVAPDGKMLATVPLQRFSGCVLKLWDATNGEQKYTQQISEKVSSIAFANSGRTLALGIESERPPTYRRPKSNKSKKKPPIEIWMIPNQFMPFEKQCFAVAAEGTTLAAADDNAVPRGAFSRVSMASRSFRRAAPKSNATAYFRGIRLWDVGSRSIRGWVDWTGKGNAIRSLSFSRDGKHLAGGGARGEVLLWSIADDQTRSNFIGHSDLVTCAAVSPDKTTLASGSRDETIRLWDLATGRQIALIDGDQSWTRLSFSSDGRELVAGTQSGEFRVFNTATKKEILRATGHHLDVRWIGFCADDSRLASLSYDGTAKVWDARTGKLVRDLSDGRIESTAMTATPDRQILLTCDSEGNICRWRAQTGERLSSFRVDESAVEMAVSPAGDSLVTVAVDGTLEIRDIESGAKRASPNDRIQGTDFLEFSPDGQVFATGSKSKMLTLRDSSTGEARFSYPASGFVVFGRDSRTLITGGTKGGEHGLMVLRAATADELKNLPAADNGAKSSRVEDDQARKLRKASWYVSRAEMYAQRRQWTRAAADYNVALQLRPEHAAIWYRLALSHLGNGDVESYRSTCRTMVRQLDPVLGGGRAPKSDKQGRPDSRELEAQLTRRLTAWCCVLAPDALPDPSKPLRIIEQFRTRQADTALSITIHGAALYRLKRYDEALTQLERAAKLATRYGSFATSSPAYTSFFLAMTHSKRGNVAESQKWMKKALDQSKPERTTTPRDLPWNRRLTLSILRSEAELLVKPTAASSKAP